MSGTPRPWFNCVLNKTYNGDINIAAGHLGHERSLDRAALSCQADVAIAYRRERHRRYRRVLAADNL
jgi:hypothetical protein